MVSSPKGLLRTCVAPLTLALAILLLAGCSDQKPVFVGSDISGTHLGRGLSLMGMDGKPFTDERFKGKVTLIFFGFTQCPDVCPTTLAELAEVLKMLGDQASNVQILMITVDPERDTPAILTEYIKAFDDRILGLTGSLAEIKQAASLYKAYYAKVPQAAGQYTMDHSASFYLIDKKGESRVLVPNNSGAAAIAKDLTILLAE